LKRLVLVGSKITDYSSENIEEIIFYVGFEDYYKNPPEELEEVKRFVNTPTTYPLTNPIL
jgi:hypothetical protein